MPVIQEGIYSAIQARVGGRVYPVTAPAKPTAPYVVYQRVAATAETDLSDSKGTLLHSRFQFDVFDVDYLNVHAIAEQIAADLASSLKAVRAAPAIDFGFEEEAGVYRVNADFYLRHT
jgi:hypothetical protein